MPEEIGFTLTCGGAQEWTWSAGMDRIGRTRGEQFDFQYIIPFYSMFLSQSGTKHGEFQPETVLDNIPGSTDCSIVLVPIPPLCNKERGRERHAKKKLTKKTYINTIRGRCTD